jgi:hypothetical protein
MVVTASFAADTSTASSDIAFNRDSILHAAFDIYPPIPPQHVDDLRPRQQSAFEAVLADVVLSESVAPARFDQNNPRLTVLSDGRLVVVWDDERSGAREVYWQILSPAGVPEGPNRLGGGSAIGANIVQPTIAIDNLDRIYIFYRNRTSGDILASRYLADGSVDLAEFSVNNGSVSDFAGPFDAALYPDGRAVVVWQSTSATGSTIEARIINNNGSFATDQFTVNTDGGATSHWVPSVDVEPTAGFLIAWEDHRNGNADIFARLFNGAGSPVGGEFAVVPSPADAAEQFAPQVEFLATDQYAIGWIDQRDGQGVWVQAYNANSGLFGSNRRLSTGGAGDLCWDINLAAIDNSYLAASWASFAATNAILLRPLDFNLNSQSDPVALIESAVGQRWAPRIQSNRSSNLALAYRELPNHQADIEVNVFDAAGVPQWGGSVTVNNDAIGAVSSKPAVAVSGDRYALFVYADQRRDAGDIFVRAINTVLEPFRGSWLVNQDAGANLQSEPDVTAVREQEALIVWIDGRVVGGLSGQRIFGRYSDIVGRLQGDDFVVSEPLEPATKNSVKAAMGSTGQDLVAWIDLRDGPPKVFGRWIAPDHSLDGGEIEFAPAVRSGSLNLDVSPDDDYCLAWLDTDAGRTVARVAWYNSAKVLENSFTFAPLTTDTTVDSIAIAAGGSKQVYLLWTGTVAAQRHVFLSLFNPDGVPLRATVSVDDDPSALPTNPAVDIDEFGYISAAWIDRRLGHRAVYYQLFDDVGSAIGSNAPAFSQAAELALSPVTAAERGHAWFGWVDPRANGMNVYASVNFYLPTDAPDDPPQGLPSEFRLAQNYPNPFNPTTTIAFALPQEVGVRLSVFNVLGRKVKTLAEGSFAAGEYSFEWGGRDESGRSVASGVYLYRLQAGEYSEMRKMVLLK